MGEVADFVAVLEKAWDAIKVELQQTPLPLWNESVFRFFVVRAMHQEERAWHCQTEWRRVDLLLEKDGVRIPIEFKFYVFARSTDGEESWAKGGPGKKNYKEFCTCLAKLRDFGKESAPAGASWNTAHRLLILVYEDQPARRGHVYASYYANPSLPEELNRSIRLESRTLEAIACGKETTLHCKLFEVIPLQ